MVSSTVKFKPANDDLQHIIQSVRKLVKEDKRLDCGTSDEFLLRFIKASAFDTKKSYQLIKDYFKAKKDSPDEFLFKSPSQYIETISRLELGYVIPCKDDEGRAILLLKLGDIDPSRENWSNLMQSATLTLESLSLDPDIQDSGVNLIFDCTNFSLKIMKWATPHKLKVIMRILQECIPVRFEVYHVVNAPLVFNVFYAALKPFMREEFIKKLHWHNPPYEALHDLIDPSFLPANLGGSLSLNTVKDWYQIVLSKEQSFNEYFAMGYN